MISFHPLCPAFGVEMLGLDLSGSIDAGTFDTIYRAFLAHQLTTATERRVMRRCTILGEAPF